MNVLLLGDTSVPEALGSKFLRASKPIGLDLQVAYSSPAPQFSPSMARKRGKVFYRLADRRSWEWWGFQRQLLEQIKANSPQLVLVTGILPLSHAVFTTIHARGGRIVNYLTDDPWNPIHRRRCFLSNLPHYDHIFSTKQALRQRLEASGVPSTSWLPFAYDPYLHHPPQQSTSAGADVLFVGTGAEERLPWLNAISSLRGVNCQLHGNNWDRYPTPGWQRGSSVTGEAYCDAIGSARIVLGLLRQANGDLSTDRSYEIGAIGGCGLYQDSSEHRVLLAGYPDEGFFSNPVELKTCVAHLLGKPELQQRLRALGAEALQSSHHTYAARLRSILDWEAASQ